MNPPIYKIRIKQNALLFLCFIFYLNNCLAATQVYNISSLINCPSSCGANSYYNGCGSAQPGFNWTDIIPAGSTVTAVQIQVNYGVRCGSNALVPRLNGVNQTSFSPSYWCNCSARSALYTLNMNSSNYIIGGTNTFRISNPQSCEGFSRWSSNISNYYARITVTYTPGCGIAAETSPDHVNASGCSEGSFTMGSGAYYNLAVEQYTYYKFTFTESASNINGFCAKAQNGNANDFTTNQTAWYSGTTTQLRVASVRSSNTWTTTSALMKYQRLTPVLSNNSPTSSTFCTGGNVSIAGGAVTSNYGTRYWQNTTNNGTSRSDNTSPHTVSASGTYRYRPYNGNPANNNGCWGSQKNTTVTVVADPTAPTASKNPNTTYVCVGNTVTIIASGGSGGTGTCVNQYRYRTYDGSAWSAWSGYSSASGSDSYTVVAGNKQVQMQARRNCNGSGCGDPASSVVTWIVDDTSPTNNGVTVNNDCWITNGSNTYTITASSTDAEMGVREIRVLINYQGGNTGAANRGGYIGWRLDGHIWSADQVTATGYGGYASKVVSTTDYGQDHITLVSASSSISGNTVTVNFVVRPTSDFPEVCGNHDISEWSRDNTCNTAVGWNNSNLNFTSMQKPSTPTASSTTICNGSSVTLTRGNSPVGGITYYWQTSPTGTSTANSGSTYSPSPSSNTTYYVRPYCSSTACWGLASNGITITVRPVFTSGSISTTGETICYNGNPVNIPGGTNASGGDNSITYRWLANGSPIAGSNSTSYNPPAGLTTTTTYIRQAHDGTCNTGWTNSSGSWIVTVNPEPTVTFTQPSACAGSSVANLLYSATTGSPNQYSINYNASAEAQGFSDVSNVTFSGSPISLTIPSSATTGTYNGVITFRNSSTGCVSTNYPLVITLIGSQASSTWNGSINTDWFENNNWSNCVPGNITDVTVPNTTNKPAIPSGTGFCKTISIDADAGARVDVLGSSVLVIDSP